jgi:hypothetical protein
MGVSFSLRLTRRLPERALGIAEQEPERVPVGCHGVRADAALMDEALSEEALD